MSPEAMAIFIATLQPELTRKSLSRFACSKRKVRRAIHSLRLSKAEGAGPSRCIALSAKPFTGKGRMGKTWCAISMDHAQIIHRKTCLGEVTPRTRPIKERTAEPQPEKNTGKSSFQRKPFALFGHQSHLGFGTRQTLRKSLALTHLLFAASPPGNVIGKVSSNSLHGPDAWAANPWVAAISFTVARRTIDAGGDA